MNKKKRKIFRKRRRERRSKGVKHTPQIDQTVVAHSLRVTDGTRFFETRLGMFSIKLERDPIYIQDLILQLEEIKKHGSSFVRMVPDYTYKHSTLQPLSALEDMTRAKKESYQCYLRSCIRMLLNRKKNSHKNKGQLLTA